MEPVDLSYEERDIDLAGPVDASDPCESTQTIREPVDGSYVQASSHLSDRLT